MPARRFRWRRPHKVSGTRPATGALRGGRVPGTPSRRRADRPPPQPPACSARRLAAHRLFSYALCRLTGLFPELYYLHAISPVSTTYDCLVALRSCSMPVTTTTAPRSDERLQRFRRRGVAPLPSAGLARGPEQEWYHPSWPSGPDHGRVSRVRCGGRVDVRLRQVPPDLGRDPEGRRLPRRERPAPVRGPQCAEPPADRLGQSQGEEREDRRPRGHRRPALGHGHGGARLAGRPARGGAELPA